MIAVIDVVPERRIGVAQRLFDGLGVILMNTHANANAQGVHGKNSIYGDE